MCTDCDHEHVLLLGQALLDAMPAPTSFRATIEDVLIWIGTNSHVTPKQRSMIAEAAARRGVQAPELGSTTNSRFRAIDIPQSDVGEPAGTPGARPRILLSCCLADHKSGRVASAAAAVEAATAGRVRLVRSDRIDWNALLSNNGSWDAVYRTTPANFDGCVLVPTEAHGLARGQYEIAIAFLAAAKSLGYLTENGRVLPCLVERADDNDWKQFYGRIVEE